MTAQGSTTIQSGTTQEGVCATEGSSQALEVSLIDVLTQLAYRKWLIAKVTGAAILTGLILSLL